MENIIMILMILSLLSFLVFGILLLIKFIFKKGLPKKRLLSLLGISFSVFIVSIILAPTSNEVTKVSNAEREIETASSDKKDNKETKPEKESKDDVGTRKNPLGKGETVNIKFKTSGYGKADIDIELLDTLYGEKANDIIIDGNQFNDLGENGQEYILAKFRIKANSIEKEPLNFANHLFSAVSEDGKSYEDFYSLSGIEPGIRVDLYEGAEHEGFAYFLVDTDDNPLGVFNRGNDSEVWFSLR